MITVAGGTGLVGKQLVGLLVQKGAQVRVLTRDAAKAQSTLGEAKVEVMVIDFDEPETLVRGFNGSAQAFLSTGTSDRQVRDEIALVDAAVQAGVSHLVNLSVGGAGGTNPNNVLGWHTTIDAHIATKAVSSTLIRPATFADTILGVASNFVPSGSWGGNAGAGRVCLTDTRDVADVAALVLLEGASKHGGKIYDLSGPTAVTMQEVAQIISNGLGKSVQYHTRSAPEQRSVFGSVGLPPVIVEVLLGLDDLTREGLFARPSSMTASLTGKAARSVSAWIEEHIGAFATRAAA